MQKSVKERLGFVGDYITIFKGNTYPFKDWLKERGAKYNPKWGWYFATNLDVPTDLPADIFPITLYWNQVSSNGEELNNDDVIKEFLDSILYDPSPSEYQGNVGDRLEVELFVNKVIDLDGYYGISHIHIMTDKNDNVYVWTTASKRWEEESIHYVRGTVKNHKFYRNCKQTILTRCRDLNEKKGA